MHDDHRLMVAAVQLCSTDDVQNNLIRVRDLVSQAAAAGAQFIALPENYGFLGSEKAKLAYVQGVDDGPFVAPLRQQARELGVAILAGSIPETGPDAQHSFNTSVLIDHQGDIVATYRKIHLFDIDVQDAVYRESAHVTPGDMLEVARVNEFKVGLSVCYDLRFPELYRALVSRGAEILCVPAAFTLQTGKDHWELLLRARAVENQCYVIAPGQWGRHGGSRVSWGKSSIIDPWGIPLATHPEGEGFVLAMIQRSHLESIRERLPALTHRRLDKLLAR